MTAQPATLRTSLRNLFLAALCLAGLALGAAVPAQANRPLITKNALETKTVPGGGIEGACGVALSGGSIYVSDYYHHAIDVFAIGSGFYQFQIPGNPLNGPCGLAASPDGALYANNWHESVSRVSPSNLSFDSEESTGVAVDQATGNVYVNDRSYIAVYEPSGVAVTVAGEPLKIGLGTLEDGYGIAVFSNKVYVPDAADNTVKVYEPATDPVNPSSLIDGAALPGGGFNSLVDATVAVDPSNGHLLVVDNLQPGFEHPEAVIYEFGAAGEFLGALGQRIVDGEPSGLAFGDDKLFATTGNDEEANVVAFGPYLPSGLITAEVPPPPIAADRSVPRSAQTVAAGPFAAEPRLAVSQTAVAGPGATLRAVTSSPGTLSVSGAGLRPVRARHVAAGSHALRLRLDRGARRALARSKLQRLAVRVGVVFTPDVGNSVGARRTVTFRQSSRGNS